MQELSLDLSRLERGVEPAAVPEMMNRSASMFPPELFERGEPTAKLFGPARPRRRVWAYAGLGMLLVCGVAIGLGLRLRRNVPAPPAAPTVMPASVEPVAEPPPVQPPPAPAPVDVLLAIDPLDAHVFRGENDLGSAPLTIAVGQGEVISLEVRRQGYLSETVTVDGKARKLTVKLSAVRGVVRAPAKKTKRGQGLQQTEIVNPWAKTR
jgi:serine/threonine-protein kinase